MWMYELGKEADIVISTRVRIARNLSNVKFPDVMSLEEAEYVKEKVKLALQNTKYSYFSLEDIDELTKLSLVEKHIISKDLLENAKRGALLMSDNLSTSVMVNEEDHIRIQAMQSGLDVDACYKEAKVVDSLLQEKLAYAYSDKYGFLTACPTNVGNAMRVSVMLHLPALSEINYIDKLIRESNRLGINIRGIYGEGSTSLGDIYQISNQNMLGEKESACIENFKKVVENIISKERKYRTLLLKQDSTLEDTMYRSYGILKYARSITRDEAYTLLSNVRLGVNLGVIKETSIEKINKLCVDINPFTLQLLNKKYMEDAERDAARAKYIREEI